MVCNNTTHTMLHPSHLYPKHRWHDNEILKINLVNIMKKSALLTLVLFMIATVAYSQMMDVKETIIEKEKAMYEAIKNGDMDTFKSNLAEDFMSVYESGISNREQELESLKNLTINTYELSDIKVMQPSENLAIIAYTLDASGMWQNEQFSGKSYATSTWMKMDDDSWKGIMHTETKATPMQEAVGMDEL